MSKLFFTSDEHYGHTNMLRFVNRPYRDIDEQTKAFIANHNAKVGRNDHTWHLGDMFWRTFGIGPALGVMAALNGTHSLTLGNHDELVEDNASLRDTFQEIVDLKYLSVPNIAKQKLILCHYAMRIWRDSHKGAWHLYGHSHGGAAELGQSFDVGVDNPRCAYGPLSMDEIIVEMSKRKCVHRIDMAKAWPGKEQEYE